MVQWRFFSFILFRLFGISLVDLWLAHCISLQIAFAGC